MDRRAFLSVILVAFFAPRAAHADVAIRPEYHGRLPCPPGSAAYEGYEWRYCAPTRCENAAQCAQWLAESDADRPVACVEDVGLCVQPPEDGFVATEREDTAPAEKGMVAVVSCDTGDTCDAPQVCRVAKRCVFTDNLPGGTGAGCGCRSERDATGSLGTMSALLVAAALRLRRRRR